MNTVGPYDNRQETYAYFSLPFCQGNKQNIDHYHETLSDALQGVELERSGYSIDFRGKYTGHLQTIQSITNTHQDNPIIVFPVFVMIATPQRTYPPRKYA